MARPRGRRLAGGIAAGVVAAIVIAGLILWRYPSDTYLLLPDKAHAAADVVTVKGERSDGDGGGVYFLDVIERKATILEDTFHQIVEDGADFVPTSQVRPTGVSESQSVQVDLGEMALSQQIAAAVAEEALGHKVITHPSGARVFLIEGGAPADGKLLPGDVIVSVDGHTVKTSSGARALMRRRRPGDVVRLGIRREGGLQTVAIKTIADPQDPSIPIVGILIDQAAQIHLPIPVKIQTGNIGGPSAGLAFALEVMEKLGHDVDRGYKVAATGEIFLDGQVGPIGGAKQKTIGARESGVDIMLVPAGDNAATARKYAGHMRIVPVESFRQALHVLATLPPKRRAAA